MTMFGKTLVLLNLAFSLFLASWAFALWTNRIDWSDAKGTADQIAGRFAQNKAILDGGGQGGGLYNALGPAESSWRLGRTEALAVEARRLADRAFYLAEIEHLENKAVAADPARQVSFAAKDDEANNVRRGQVVIDPRTRLPVMEQVKDLQSLAFYDKELEQRLAQRAAADAKHKEQIDEAVKLTEQLIGPKGLQQRLVDERHKYEDVIDELKVVYPLVVNTKVESELILKRRAALRKRIDELKGVGVAARRE